MTVKKQPRILIVDDKDDILFLVQTILELEGYHIAKASNGYEAVELCKKENFSVIFLDLMMEGKDGYETITEMRDMEGNKDAYIIALTAKAYETDKQNVLSKGFDDHFPKPFRASELIEKTKQGLAVYNTRVHKGMLRNS